MGQPCYVDFSNSIDNDMIDTYYEIDIDFCVECGGQNIDRLMLCKDCEEAPSSAPFEARMPIPLVEL